MIVCVCRRISDRDIVRAAKQGLDFDAIQMELGVGLQCGSCAECACELVAQCRSAAPVAALHRAEQASTGGDGNWVQTR
jgi:bacterioferritin-associated ferredoxin